MGINPHIFREYDIRGEVGKDLTPQVAFVLGRAFGTYLRKANTTVAALGRDCRLSSEDLARAMAEGLSSTGVECFDYGVIPTPLLYFALFESKGVVGRDIEAGVMVTGSHNPKEYNGFKLCAGRAALYGEKIREVARIAEAQSFVEGSGSVHKAQIVEAYIQRLLSDARIGPRRLKVVIDAGNGTAGEVAVPLFERLGLTVIPLFCEMDGNFPNHHPDPTVPENLAVLRRRVVSEAADLGIAYDGDGDRLGVVTEKGDIVFGDMILLILAKALLKEVPGARIVSEVKCSQVLFDEIERAGGRAEMWKVGHSLIKARMAQIDSPLGGEMSGHIFYRHRWYGFDDAIYASLRLVEVLSSVEGPISSLLEGIPKTYSTPEIRIECPDEVKFKVVDSLVTFYKQTGFPVVDVDGARVRFAHGWGLVRASNTQPVLVFRFEALSEEALKEIKEAMVGKAMEVKKEVLGGQG